MDQWNVKSNMRLPLILKLNKRFCNRCFLQESKLIGAFYFAAIDSCILIQIIIGTESGFI